jgi:hypothetical protein
VGSAAASPPFSAGDQQDEQDHDRAREHDDFDTTLGDIAGKIPIVTPTTAAVPHVPC